MQIKRETMTVTGAAKGIGAGVTKAFIERGYNVVVKSQNITASTFAPTALETFGSIDGVVNNTGIFVSTPFTGHTAQDFGELSGTKLQGADATSRGASPGSTRRKSQVQRTAPRVANTPMHAIDSSEFLKSRSPMGKTLNIADIVESRRSQLEVRQEHEVVIWGKRDLSAYRQDEAKAEIHVLDAGHFAVDTAVDEIAVLVENFASDAAPVGQAG